MDSILGFFKVGNINWQKEKTDHTQKSAPSLKNVYLDILVYGHFPLIFAHLQVLLRINC